MLHNYHTLLESVKLLTLGWSSGRWCVEVTGESEGSAPHLGKQGIWTVGSSSQEKGAPQRVPKDPVGVVAGLRLSSGGLKHTGMQWISPLTAAWL